MKNLTWIVCAALVVATSSGCNLKDKVAEQTEQAAEEAMEQAAEEVEQAAEEAEQAAEEAEQAAEELEAEAEVEETEMAVDKEEIEKAAELYAIIHDEELSEEERMEKTEEMLEEFEWDMEAYKALQYDISQDPASRTYYAELTEGEQEGEE
jgi:outer membrane murein-binding lipoprotein Lpp